VITGAGAVEVADVTNVVTLVSVEDGTKTVLVLWRSQQQGNV
jgi:hypothetical protein